MLSEMILLKLKKNLSEKKMNPISKASHSASAIDDISNEISSLMQDEIKKNPYFLNDTISGFKNEIQLELAEDAIKNCEHLTRNKLHDKT